LLKIDKKPTKFQRFQQVAGKIQRKSRQHNPQPLKKCGLSVYMSKKPASCAKTGKIWNRNAVRASWRGIAKPPAAAHRTLQHRTPRTAARTPHTSHSPDS
jgi:hypothetical protein